MTGSAGQVVWQSRFEAFGSSIVESDPDGNGVPITYNLRFPGQYLDTETGFHYNYLREYDPSTGRYTTRDPIGLGGGINPYTYVNGSVTNLIDPLGDQPPIARTNVNQFNQQNFLPYNSRYNPAIPSPRISPTTRTPPA